MRIQASIFLFLLMLPTAALPQIISIGVKGGVPLTDPTRYNHDESRRYTVGPSIEIRLPGRFAVEASALYQRLGNTSSFNFNQNFGQNSISTSYTTRERGNSWEFPLLGKYYFHSPSDKWEPYLGTGYVFRNIRLHADGQTVTTDSAGAALSSNVSHYAYGTGLGIGATAAAGVRIHSGRFAILPEIRYTRWGGTDNYQIPRNDVKLLVGITF